METSAPPSPEQTLALAAAVDSHRSWNAARARAGGGEVRACAGGLMAHVPDPATGGGGGSISVMFVEAPWQRPAVVANELLDWIAGLPPLRSVGWWTSGTEAGLDLGVILMARGFQWGWQPHWMWLDLSRPRPAALLPAGIDLVCFPDGAEGEAASRLPPFVRAFGARREALTRLDRPATTVLAAFDAEEVVGSITLHVSPPSAELAQRAAEPIGGIYDCWVAERVRRRGIGLALTAAAAGLAEARGCRMAVLNATAVGELMYRRLGFRSAGWGRTWWLVERQLRAPRPDADMVAFVEAIGRGDVPAMEAALAALRGREGGVDLDAALPCAETPLGAAVRLRQPRSARRLIELGAELDIVSAWDLGWRDTVADLLRDHPELANRRVGESGATPLQVAIERDDEGLAALVLSAHPDLGLKDLTYGGDALGWAEHFGRAHLAALIREAQARGSGTARG